MRRCGIVVTVLAVCSGCVSFAPRPDSFGAAMPVGPDCREIAGTYSNDAGAPHAYVQLTGLLALPSRLTHHERHPAARVSIEMVDPRSLRLSALAADGSVLATRELQSPRRFGCSQGELQMAFPAREYGPFPAMGFVGRDKFFLTRSADGRLLVRSSRQGVSYFLVLPFPGVHEAWFSFLPVAP